MKVRYKGNELTIKSYNLETDPEEYPLVYAIHYNDKCVGIYVKSQWISSRTSVNLFEKEKELTEMAKAYWAKCPYGSIGPERKLMNFQFLYKDKPLRGLLMEMIALTGYEDDYKEGVKEGNKYYVVASEQEHIPIMYCFFAKDDAELEKAKKEHIVFFIASSLDDFVLDAD